MSADRNLLCGILALQMDLVSRDQLIAAMHAWVLDKGKPLGDILVEQHALQPDEQFLLDALVLKHLARHGGDAETSLAALSIAAPLRDELHSLADEDLGASLAHLPAHTVIPVDDPLRPSIATGRTCADNPVGPYGAAGLRYRVLRPHAQGGLGEVFVALDRELQRQVVLKEIRPEYAHDLNSRGRFIQEAEVTGGLEHPGIVPVYGLGAYADGRPFYAMRFIRGESLKDAISRLHEGGPGRDAQEQARALRGLLTRVIAVCNAVAYAHSRGVLHRDLKPANVMLGQFGETLVVDWGLAKAVGRETTTVGNGLDESSLRPQLADGIEATQEGAAMGTPAYMSPEQAAGKLDKLGPDSDVYSLGATLYTLLTGKALVEGRTVGEVLRKVQQGEWRPPRQMKPDVPPALDAVCCKALALRPEERYGSALELAADVERWLAGEPVSAWAEPWAVRARRWLGRHRTLVTSAAAVVAVALVGMTLGVVLLQRRVAETEAVRRWSFYAAVGDYDNAAIAASGIPQRRKLKGGLVIRVRKGADKELRLGDPGTLPVLDNDEVRVEITLSEPAHIYLMFADRAGVQAMYPWRDFQFTGNLPDVAPRDRLALPEEVEGLQHRGLFYQFKDAKSGKATFLLLATREALPKNANLSALLRNLPPLPADKAVSYEILTATGDEFDGAPDQQDSLVELVRRLQPHFDLIQVHRFPFRGED
jgi:serine/threonine protein kinase